MDLKQLHYFVEVAQAGNVSRAATRVWISQPALSRQMQLLEQELGVQLFERKARGVMLTDAGKLLQQRAAVLLKDVALMKEEVSARSLEPIGGVGLAVPTALRSLLTARVTAGFCTAHPKAVLTVHEGMSRSARDMVASLPEDYRPIADARIALRSNSATGNDLIANMTPAQRQDPGGAEGDRPPARRNIPCCGGRHQQSDRPGRI